MPGLPERPNVCETGLCEVCDGGFAEETELPARLLVRHEPALDPAIAAMAEPLAVALHAVRRLAARAGQPVLVAGCGPIGGMAAVLLSRLHDGPVLIADRNPVRAAKVAAVTGATVVDLDAGSIRAALGERVLRNAIDATGNIRVLSALLDLIAGGGSLALVGIAHGRIDLDPNALVEREIALVGCHAFADELPEAVAMLGELAPALGPLIDQEIAIDGIPAAYERLIAGESAGSEDDRPDELTRLEKQRNDMDENGQAGHLKRQRR